jgi:endonuclease/exonuclease/phosphatase family metal-dependent hydrolase
MRYGRGFLHGLQALVAALLLPLASCDLFNTGFDDTEVAVLYRARNPGPEPALAFPATIRVMTWNVKYGGARLRFFWECNGDRYLMTEGEVNGNLDRMAARIRLEAPDVVLLQEVDTWRSKRVAYVDQVQGLLDRIGLNYGAYASQWKADYVPTDGLGPVDSGNAILSRWPITYALRHALPLETDLSGLERYFYLKRNLLETRIAVPVAGGSTRDVAVVDLHAEAFSQDGTKKKHIDAFKALADAIAATGTPLLAGGDFNAIPPGSWRRSDFPEDAGCTGGRFAPDTYVGEETWLDPLYAAYVSDAPPTACGAEGAPECTFVGDEHFPLNRKLDHLFTNTGWDASSPPRVLQDALMLSDHVPVVAGWEVP